MGTASEQQAAQAPSVDDELMALSAKHQNVQSYSGVTVVLLSIFAALGAVVFSLDIHDAQEEEDTTEPCVDEPSQEGTSGEEDVQKSEAHSPALWPCAPLHLQGLLHSAIVVISVLSLAVAISQVRGAMASINEENNVPSPNVDNELMALSTKHQNSQSCNGATVVLLGIFAALGAVVFSFDMQDAQDEDENIAETCVAEPSQEVESEEQKPQAKSRALWPCTPFHLHGLMHSAVIVIGVVGLAIMVSQVRAALVWASNQSNAQAESIDDELMALSAKYQSSPLLSNQAIAMLLCIFSVLGALVFSFDMHDAEEESETSVNKTSKEVINENVDEQQSEVRKPVLWPCTPFHLQGLLRSVILVIGVISLAIVTSQLRAVVGSQNEQHPIQAQGADNELMALTAKHQHSRSSNGMSAVMLTLFAILGGIIISFDVHDSQEEEKEEKEEKAVESSVGKTSKQSEVQAPSKQSEVQSMALPCPAL
jgi:hypothetical protein